MNLAETEDPRSLWRCDRFAELDALIASERPVLRSQCRKCRHKWTSIAEEPRRNCPKCGTSRWKKQTYTVTEKVRTQRRCSAKWQALLRSAEERIAVAKKAQSGRRYKRSCSCGACKKCRHREAKRRYMEKRRMT